MFKASLTEQQSQINPAVTMCGVISLNVHCVGLSHPFLTYKGSPVSNLTICLVAKAQINSRML
jgi:hypothetical protein